MLLNKQLHHSRSIPRVVPVDSTDSYTLLTLAASLLPLGTLFFQPNCAFPGKKTEHCSEATAKLHEYRVGRKLGRRE